MTEMTRTAHTFVDAYGVTIHYYVWEADAPRAVVQLVHGVGEYATRYDRFARALVAAGVHGVRRRPPRTRGHRPRAVGR